MALSQTLPPAAEDYAAEQRREIGAAVSAGRRIWSGMGDDFDRSFLTVGAELLRVSDLAQQRVAASAREYVPQVLVETGQSRAAQPRFAPNNGSLVGTAGDGLPVEGLLYGAVTHAKVMVGAGATSAEALASGGAWLSTAIGTLLSDTGRASERLEMQARPVTGYVRMLTPPSCGRCVVLAGKRAHTSEPFLRHPGCDCRNIPASESVAGDLTVDPRAHLNALSNQELARTLGSKANAQAYRDGADMNQLINAYRRRGAVSAAQVYGRGVKYTTEATTKRSAYGRSARAAGRDLQRTPRLMPESIDQIATDSADRMRLLRLYGWIL